MIEAVRGLTVCIVAIALGACSGPSARPSPAGSHRGGTSDQSRANEHMAHHRLAIGTTSSGALLIDQPAPSYPYAMLASCPAEVRLHALLIVDTYGKVEQVRVDEATGAESVFAAAVRAAARQWRFEPRVISRWAANANNEMHAVDTETTPFSRAYAFRFACHSGRAEVSVSSTTQDGQLQPRG